MQHCRYVFAMWRIRAAVSCGARCPMVLALVRCPCWPRSTLTYCWACIPVNSAALGVVVDEPAWLDMTCVSRGLLCAVAELEHRGLLCNTVWHGPDHTCFLAGARRCSFVLVASLPFSRALSVALQLSMHCSSVLAGSHSMVRPSLWIRTPLPQRRTPPTSLYYSSSPAPTAAKMAAVPDTPPDL